MTRWKPQFRIAHLLWITLVVCAFFCGQQWQTADSPEPETGVFSFYIGVLR